MNQSSKVSISSGLEQVRFQNKGKQSKVVTCAVQPCTSADH